MRRRFIASLLALLLLPHVALCAQNPYRIAIYYYPGWKDGAFGLFAGKPWDLIKPYPEREPLLGWYKEGEVDVMTQHLSWMKSYGIDQIIFDWYWDGERNTPYLAHALDAYYAAPNRSSVGFAIHWSNHRPFPFKKDQFDLMVQYWLTQIFSQTGYWLENGMPVVFIFSPDLLEKSARQIGETTRSLLDQANKLAKARGFLGIKFIANSNASWGDYGPAERGFSTLSGYVYQRAYSGLVEDYPNDYKGLVNGYKTMWSWIIKNLTIEYWPPVAFGWDTRPWGGKDKKDSCCANTPEAFEAHLKDARNLVDSNPERTKKTVVICCWNEFGEGNYVEPTKANGFKYLNIIRSVFKSN